MMMMMMDEKLHGIVQFNDLNTTAYYNVCGNIYDAIKNIKRQEREKQREGVS